MKELTEWEKRLREQARQWEDPLPRDGWQRLSQALSDGPARQRAPRQRRRWFLALPAAAAALAVGYVLLAPRPARTPQPAGVRTETAPRPVAKAGRTYHRPAAPAPAGRAEQPAFAAPPAALPRQAEKAAPALALVAAAEAVPTPAAAPTDSAARPVPAERPAPRQRAALRGGRRQALASARLPADERAGHSRPQLSVAVSGGPAATERHDGYVAAPAALLSPSALGAENTPGASALLAHNLRQPSESRIRHRLPLQLTLGVDFPLTERLTIGSGISYTRTTTDIEGGSTEAYYHTRQHLHYIGVPLRIGYTFARTSWADFYASGEARIAVSVGAEQQTEYVVEQARTGEAVTTHSGRGLWQGAFTVAAGLELRLGQRAGLFVEPGLMYALPDGSSVPTPYHDQPFRFSLQAGLRWKLR